MFTHRVGQGARLESIALKTNIDVDVIEIGIGLLPHPDRTLKFQSNIYTVKKSAKPPVAQTHTLNRGPQIPHRCWNAPQEMMFCICSGRRILYIKALGTSRCLSSPPPLHMCAGQVALPGTGLVANLIYICTDSMKPLVWSDLSNIPR